MMDELKISTGQPSQRKTTSASVFKKTANGGRERKGFLHVHRATQTLHYFEERASTSSSSSAGDEKIVVPLDLIKGIHIKEECDFNGSKGENSVVLRLELRGETTFQFSSIREAQQFREELLPICGINEESKEDKDKENHQRMEDGKRKLLLDDSAATAATATSTATLPPSSPEATEEPLTTLASERSANERNHRFIDSDDPELAEIPPPLPSILRRSDRHHGMVSVSARTSGAFAISGGRTRIRQVLGGGRFMVPSDDDNNEEEDSQQRSAGPDANNAHQPRNNNNDADPDEGNMLVEATLVNDSNNNDPTNQPSSAALEEEQEVIHAKPLEAYITRRSAMVAGFLVLIIIASVLVGFLVFYNDALESSAPPTLSPTSSPTSSPTFRQIPTLERIQERGHLLCGVHTASDVVHNALYYNAAEEEATSDVEKSADIRGCMGLAAAILGKSSFQVQVVFLNDTKTGLEALANREADVVLTNPTPSMADDIYNPDTRMGYSIITPTAADGLTFGGDPFYTACADDDLKSFNECEDLKVCLLNGTASHGLVARRIPNRNIVLVNTLQEVYGMFALGICNVMGLLSVALSEIIIRDLLNYKGPYAIGNNRFTRTVFSAMTLDTDPEFTDFVNAMILASFAAEQMQVTSANATLLGKTNLFGTQYEDAFSDAIAVAGNIGELQSTYQYQIVSKWNQVNDGTSGLLYATDFVGVERLGPDPSEEGTLSTILGRGSMRCGVQVNRQGFADYINSGTGNEDLEGLDAEYCRAIAAAVFSGEANRVEFIAIPDQTDGYMLLSEGTIDVLAGATWTLQNDVREPTTGDGFSFSRPYFYAPLDHLDDERFDDNLCLATRQDDSQWSSFVYYTALSLVLAEDKGITQRYSSQMPQVNLFGTGFVRILQDALHAVGNHGQVYNNTVERFLPRKERNLINSVRNPGPQLYVLPGFDQLVQK